MKHEAHLIEIFSSLQGEGLYMGQSMTFVRFGRCHLKCQYCDTPQGTCHEVSCRVETPARSGNFQEIPNSVSITRMDELLACFDDETISVTGGEPLEQADFLTEWLPTASAQKRILLETNGLLHAELSRVLPFVHIISMDLKLPSSTGRQVAWADHAAFLKCAVASGRDLYVKLVVTAKTTDRDLQQAISTINATKRYIPVFIQPVSQTLTFHQTISPERLGAVERLLTAYLDDVRTVPQMHKQWGVL